jgi:hypothetical protein
MMVFKLDKAEKTKFKKLEAGAILTTGFNLFVLIFTSSLVILKSSSGTKVIWDVKYSNVYGEILYLLISRLFLL